jgi:hypothetical protein
MGDQTSANSRADFQINDVAWRADNVCVTVCAQSATIDRAATAPRVRGIAFLIAACFASALIGRLCLIVCPFDADGGMFIYMGKLVAHGGRIGYELIDNKFPTVGLITSPAWRAFGANWSGYVFCQMALTLVAVWILARCARRNIGPHAELPVGLFALVYLNFHFAVHSGFQLETLQSFFSILSAAAAIEAIARDDARDSFLVGLASGVAAMVKPSGLAPLAAFALIIAWQKRRELGRLVTHGAGASLGLAIPVAASLLYFQAAELFPVLPTIWKQISDYASNSPWELWDLSKPVIVFLIAGFPMIILGLVFRRDRHRVNIRPEMPIVLFAITWAAIEFAGVAAQRRMYAYHFLVVAGPASLLFGLIPRHPRAIPLAAALSAPIIFSIYGAGQVLAKAPETMGLTASETYFCSHAQPGDTIWEDGMMRLLILTDMQPGSRYPMTFLWANTDTAPLEMSGAMLADFEQTRPKYIVFPTKFQSYGVKLADRIKELGLRPQRRANFIEAWNNLGDYIHADYRPLTHADWETIYVRKDP